MAREKISSMFKKRNNPLPFTLQLLAGAVLSPPLSLCHAPPAPHKYWKHREVVYFSAGSESAYVAGRESESARTPAAVALGPAEKSVLTPKPKKRGLERERGGGGEGLTSFEAAIEVAQLCRRDMVHPPVHAQVPPFVPRGADEVGSGDGFDGRADVLVRQRGEFQSRERVRGGVRVRRGERFDLDFHPQG